MPIANRAFAVPDQDPAVDREEAPPELLVDRRDRLDRAAVETNDVAAVRQRPPPSASGRQRGDLAALEPALSALAEQAVPSADEPSHGP